MAGGVAVGAVAKVLIKVWHHLRGRRSCVWRFRVKTPEQAQRLVGYFQMLGVGEVAAGANGPTEVWVRCDGVPRRLIRIASDPHGMLEEEFKRGLELLEAPDRR